ncbi:hypothetical protein MCOR02_012389 [Pyricularia oryzae]|nr:hypothetical protein MCOR02_012389 [Pyricularia oryzae]
MRQTRRQVPEVPLQLPKQSQQPHIKEQQKNRLQIPTTVSNPCPGAQITLAGWNPGNDKLTGGRGSPHHSNARSNKYARVGPSGQQSRRALGSRGGGGVSDATGEVEKVNELVKQPETRPIGQEQLVAEVKGIYAGLELLRHRLPHSLEYMLTFIYSSYSMTALLYETVPAFEYTWIECLGDLSRYRMAIEDDDVRDREVWAAVSRDCTAFYYAKSLCVPIPFNSARDSILTLFEPIMAGTHGKLHAVDRALVRCHGTFFTGNGTEDLEDAQNEFFSNLDLAVAKGARRWLEAGYQIAVTNLCALLDYGLPTNILMRALDASTKDTPMPKTVVGDEAQEASRTQQPANTDDENAPVATATEAQDDVVDLPKRFKEVLQFVESTDTIVLSRLGI